MASGLLAPHFSYINNNYVITNIKKMSIQSVKIRAELQTQSTLFSKYLYFSFAINHTKIFVLLNNSEAELVLDLRLPRRLCMCCVMEIVHRSTLLQLPQVSYFTIRVTAFIQSYLLILYCFRS